MQNRGFTLLEMLIVLLIAGILLSFAFPSYQTYWTRAHRLEGQMGLLDLANQMELYYAKYGTYTDAVIGSGTEHDVMSESLTTEGWYKLVIQSASATHFNLQAIPQNTQAQQDTLCQTLQFNDQGIQSIVGGTGAWAECWG